MQAEEPPAPRADSANASAAGPVRRRARLAPIATAGAVPDGCLVIDEFGSFVGKQGERLRILVKGEVVAERSLVGLEHVLVVGRGVAFSAEAVRACAESGVSISFLSGRGRPYAKLLAPELTGTVQTRRHQLLAYLDARGVHLARAFAGGKLRNQAALLKYMAKYRQRVDLGTYEFAREAAFRCEHLARRVDELEGACVDAVRTDLMNLEAQGA